MYSSVGQLIEPEHRGHKCYVDGDCDGGDVCCDLSPWYDYSQCLDLPTCVSTVDAHQREDCEASGGLWQNSKCVDPAKPEPEPTPQPTPGGETPYTPPSPDPGTTPGGEEPEPKQAGWWASQTDLTKVALVSVGVIGLWAWMAQPKKKASGRR